MNKFSLGNYTRILKYLRSTGIPQCSFLNPEKGILLRHDVDYCLSTAAELARINAGNGTIATFFVLINSPLYNTFSGESRKALETISSCGQHIGLHYHHDGGNFDLQRLQTEFEALRMLVPDSQKVVAWHNPEGDLAILNKAAEQTGFVSSYSDPFFKDCTYISDSNCRNTADKIIKAIHSRTTFTVQLLIHPCIWIHGGDGIEYILEKEFLANLQKTIVGFEGNLLWKEQLGDDILTRIRHKKWSTP